MGDFDNTITMINNINATPEISTSIKTIVGAIAQHQPPVTSDQKQQILAGITNEELRKQVALKMEIDPETTNQLKQSNLK